MVGLNANAYKDYIGATTELKAALPADGGRAKKLASTYGPITGATTVTDYYHGTTTTAADSPDKTTTFAGLNSAYTTKTDASNNTVPVADQAGHDKILTYRFGTKSDGSAASGAERAKAFVEFFKDTQGYKVEAIGKWFARERADLDTNTTITYAEIHHTPFTGSAQLSDKSIEILILKELGFTVNAS